MTQQRVSPITVTSLLPATVLFKGQAALGQSADLLQLNNSSGTTLLKINPSGQLLLSGSNASSVTALNRALQIEGNSASTTGITLIRNSNDTTGVGLFLAKSRGTTSAAVTAVQSGDVLGFISASGTDGTVMNTTIGQIDFSVDGTVSTSIIPTRIGFTTEASNGNIAERARITSGGLLLINSTSATLGSGGVPSQFGLVSNAATTVGAVIRGAASQTADLTQWQNSAGTNLVKVNATGTLVLSGPADQIGIVSSDSSGTSMKFDSGAANGRAWRIGGNFVVGNGEFSIYDTTASKEYFRISATGAISTLNGAGIAAAGAVTSASATGGIGYATGAGGTVTQATSKSTGVTLNTVTGQITMNGAALAANTAVSFTLTDSAIASTDVVHVQHVSAGTVGGYFCTATPAAGSATIYVRNVTAGSLSEAIVLQFVVIKAVTA